MVDKQIIAPSQTRIIPIKLEQTAQYFGNLLTLNIRLVEYSPIPDLARNDTGRTITLSVVLNIRHVQLWSTSSWEALRATFFFASTHPTYFLAKPPIHPISDGKIQIPILALRKLFILSHSYLCLLIWPRWRGSWYPFISILGTGNSTAEVFLDHNGHRPNGMG